MDDNITTLLEVLKIHSETLDILVKKNKEYEKVFKILAQEIAKNRKAINLNEVERIKNK